MQRAKISVGLIGDSHIARISDRVTRLSVELPLDVSIQVRARGGRGINRPPCAPASLNYDVTVVLLGGNDLASYSRMTGQELAEKLFNNFRQTGRIVMFCSLWNRKDVDVVTREHFNRRLRELTNGQDTMFHLMDSKMNTKLRADGVHLNQRGEYLLMHSVKHALRRSVCQYGTIS